MFSRIFIERPRLAIVVSLVMSLAGFIALNNLPVAEYPEIAPPSLFVSAVYSGASADVVAQTVAIPLEDEINSVQDLLYFSSTSSNEGSYACTVTFKSGTNTDIALVNLQNAVKRAEARLPSEVTKVGITVEKRGNDMLAAIAFTTDGSFMNINELTNYVNDNIKDTLARVDGVSSSSLMSQNEYAMRVWMDPLRMAGLGVSTSDIRSAIEAQNIQAAAGSIGSEGSNKYVAYKVNVQGRLGTAEEFGNIIVRSLPGEGRIVHLRDVADVELGASAYTGKSFLNKQEAVGLSLYRSPEANALATINRVKAELELWKSRLPAGVNYVLAYDPTRFIHISMLEMVTTLISALLLVVFVTWIFLQDWRATLIPTVAIPVSLLGTMAILYALNYSLNTLTMFGLILVIGSLVDDAIVVVENCQSLMEREGLSPHDAAVKNMQQITGAVISTTLVTVACYLPLAFYGGMVGAIYRQFSISMCVSLCLSAVVALTLSPALCALILRKPDGHVSPMFKPVNAFLNWTKRHYLGCVGIMVRRGALTIGLYAALALMAYALYGFIPPSFLPSEDKGVIMCNIELPSDATEERTLAVLDEFRKRLSSVQGIETVMMISGMSMLSGSGENVALAILALDDWEKRKAPEQQVQMLMARIQQEASSIAPASIISFTPPAIMGLGMTGGATFNISGVGDVTPASLAKVTMDFLRELSSSPDAMYAMSPYNASTPQIRFHLDREKAEMLGVAPNTIFAALQNTLASYYVNDFTLNGHNFDVKIQGAKDYRGTINTIRETLVPNSEGDMVPLSSLGELVYEIGPRQITRFDKMLSAEINAQTVPGVSSLYPAIEAIRLPRDYHLEWTGLSYQERQNAGQIVVLMGLALLFAYLFLVALYESWCIPLPVMLTVLFAVTGALLGLLLTHGSMSIYAQLGLVMLIGLSAKNAILMVEFSKQEREHGVPIAEAALNGANLRFRAVMMTAWSFIFGVMPLFTATGAGAASRRAIGITTFSGMLVATCVGIIATPALYAIFERTRTFKFTGSKPHLGLLALLLGLTLLLGCAQITLTTPAVSPEQVSVPETFPEERIQQQTGMPSSPLSPGMASTRP